MSSCALSHWCHFMVILLLTGVAVWRAQSLVVPEEAAQVKMLWEAPEDDWEEYILTHMHTIRAKYFPKKTPEQVRQTLDPETLRRPAACVRRPASLCSLAAE